MNRYLSWNLMAPDTLGVYRPLALSVMDGKGYQLDGDRVGATRVAPGFPLYLAAVYRAFGSDVSVWRLGVLNALMRVAVTALVYVLALRVFGAAAAWCAAIVHAIDPWEAFWCAFVLKESLAVLLSIAAIALVARAFATRSWPFALASGFAIGIASLARYASLGLFPWTLLLFALAAWRSTLDRRLLARLAVAATIGLVAALAPWLARNRVVLGAPIVDTQPGYYLYVSNGPGTEKNPDTWGYSGLSTADQNNARAIAAGRAGAIDRDTAFFAATLRHVAAHPLQAAGVAAARFLNMWRPTFAGASIANRVVLGGFFVLFAVAAIVGCVIGVRPTAARRRDDAFALYWFVLFYVVLHAAFWSEIRYRQYATPLLAVFAGAAIASAGRPGRLRYEVPGVHQPRTA